LVVENAPARNRGLLGSMVQIVGRSGISPQSAYLRRSRRCPIQISSPGPGAFRS
jgi:hypothetical protein